MYMFGCKLLNIRKLQVIMCTPKLQTCSTEGIVSAEDMGKNAGLEKMDYLTKMT